MPSRAVTLSPTKNRSSLTITKLQPKSISQMPNTMNSTTTPSPDHREPSSPSGRLYEPEAHYRLQSTLREAHTTQALRERGYDQNGWPYAPRGVLCRPNGFDFTSQRTNFSCRRQCLHSIDQAVVRFSENCPHWINYHGLRLVEASLRLGELHEIHVPYPVPQAYYQSPPLLGVGPLRAGGAEPIGIKSSKPSALLPREPMPRPRITSVSSFTPLEIFPYPCIGIKHRGL